MEDIVEGTIGKCEGSKLLGSEDLAIAKGR